MQVGLKYRDVLVVEDDRDVRLVVAEVLREHGCRVYVAGDGAEALAILRVILPDLIVTDLMMPRVTGWELCDLLQRDRRWASTPVAVITAFADAPPVPGMRFLRKPLDLRSVASLVSEDDPEPEPART